MPSWAAIDGAQTIRRRRIGQHIGQIDRQTMLTIDRLLLVFLGLAGDDGGWATRRDSTGAFVKPTLRTTRQPSDASPGWARSTCEPNGGSSSPTPRGRGSRSGAGAVGC